MRTDRRVGAQLLARPMSYPQGVLPTERGLSLHIYAWLSNHDNARICRIGRAVGSLPPQDSIPSANRSHTKIRGFSSVRRARRVVEFGLWVPSWRRASPTLRTRAT